jgi:hypothetical protein
MYEGVDTVVLDNELAFQDVLPVQWMAMWEPPDRFELLGLEEANLLLLQACVAVEEHPARDPNEDLGPLAGEIARLDFKLNLVMQLLAKLVAKDRMPPATPILFNGQDAAARRSRPAAGAAAQLAAAAPGAAGAGGRGGRQCGQGQVSGSVGRRRRADCAPGVRPSPASRRGGAQGTRLKAGDAGKCDVLHRAVVTGYLLFA